MMTMTEPMEVRFHGNGKSERGWQLLVSVANNGTLNYRLESVPQGNYSYSLTYLVGNTNKHKPMKAYEGWQEDVLAWLASLALGKGPCYTINEVL